MKRIIIAMFIVLMSFPLSAQLIHGKFELGTSSKDVFRGDVAEDGFVLNPDFRLSIGDLRLNTNSVFNAKEGHMTRTYATLRYEIGLENGLKITPGLSYHHYWPSELKNIADGIFDSTAEVSCGVSYELYGETLNKSHAFAVGLYSTHYFNIQADPGAYRGNFGIAMVDEIKKFAMGFSAEVSWGWYIEAEDVQIPHSLSAKAYFMYKITELFYAKVHGGASIAVDPDLRDRMGDNAQFVYGGLNLGFEF